MKKLISIFLTLLVSSISLLGQTTALENIEAFLGKEKTAALNQLTKSFEDFLISNFPAAKSENERIYKFQEGFKDWSILEKDWKIDFPQASKTLNQFEHSGLRIEHWIYGYEKYEPTYPIDSSRYSEEDPSNLDSLSLGKLSIEDIEEEIIPITNKDYDRELAEKLQRQRDSSQSLNLNGQFLYALLQYTENDALIKEYTKAILAAGDVSTSLKAGGLTYENQDLSTPLRKRLVVMDFYYHFLKWQVENK